MDKVILYETFELRVAWFFCYPCFGLYPIQIYIMWTKAVCKLQTDIKQTSVICVIENMQIIST